MESFKIEKKLAALHKYNPQFKVTKVSLNFYSHKPNKLDYSIFILACVAYLYFI